MGRVFLSFVFAGMLAATEKVEISPAIAVVAPSSAKVIQYSQRDVVPLRVKDRYTTIIVLPKEEKILDFVIGDSRWVVKGAENMAYVNPTDGANTNLNLITASGNVYSFTLTEHPEPDLKVFIQLHDTGMQEALGRVRFVAVDDVKQYEKRALAAEASVAKIQEAAKAQVEKAKQEASESVAKFRAEYPSRIKSPYRFEKGKRPFYVQNIWTDGKFTYIEADSSEIGAVYEIRDDNPSVVDFKFKDGVYTIHKVVEKGYLKIGKEELKFYARRG